MTGKEKNNYILTFPDSNFDYLRKNITPDDFVVRKENVPIVILLGWGGALDKHLQVYSKIYEEKGLITLRYICPVVFLVWKYSKMADSAKNVIQLFNEPSLEKKNIIIHLFSNGGCFEYDFFIKALEDNFNDKQIKGVIFDSAPAGMTFPRVFEAINSMKLNSNTLWGKFETFMIVTIHFTMKYCKRLHSKFSNKDLYEWNPVENLKYEANRCPQHFIYSKADPLVPYKEVEYFIKCRKAVGVDVTSQLYEDTPHVRHYPFNKLSYRRSIFQFLSKCLRR